MKSNKRETQSARYKQQQAMKKKKNRTYTHTKEHSRPYTTLNIQNNK